MEDLQPVIDVVKQRLADGESVEVLKVEMLDKGYSSEQVEQVLKQTVPLTEIPKPKKKVSVFKKIVFWLMVFLLVTALLALVTNSPNRTLNVASNQTITSDFYYEAFNTGDIVFNTNTSNFKQEYPEIEKIIRVSRYQVNFDGEDPRFFLGSNDGKLYIYDNIENKLSSVPDGPWRPYCSFFVAMTGPSCQYGESWLITDSGHLFVYVNTQAGNVYRNDSATGLYIFIGNRWTKIADKISDFRNRQEAFSVETFNREELFVTDDGCKVYFTQGDSGSSLTYSQIQLCSDDVINQNKSQATHVTLDENERTIMYLSRAVNIQPGRLVPEESPNAVRFRLNMFPARACEEISADVWSMLKLDMGDGSVIPVTCGVQDAYVYDRGGVYDVKLKYQEETLFQDSVPVNTFVENVQFDLTVKANDGRYRNGDYYVEIVYATDPTCNLSDADKDRVSIGTRTKHSKNGPNYAEDYGSLGNFEYGACQGVTTWPLTTNPNDRDETKTVRFEYKVDGVVRAQKDVTFPSSKINSASEVQVEDSLVNVNIQKDSTSSEETVSLFEITNASPKVGPSGSFFVL